VGRVFGSKKLTMLFQEFHPFFQDRDSWAVARDAPGTGRPVHGVRGSDVLPHAATSGQPERAQVSTGREY